jgi:hypothetical protein
MKAYAHPLALSVGFFALAACGGADATPGDDPTADAGTPDARIVIDAAMPPIDPDASSVDGGPKSQATQLTAGEIGIVSTLVDGTIIFLRYGSAVSLEAIAPTGGTPTVIVPALILEGEDTDDVISVIGGVVGIWTGVDADTGLGKLSVWSRANGLKEAAPVSPIYEVDSSADGSRVAFVRSVGAELQLVTSPSTFAGGSIVIVQANLGDGSAANPCGAFYTFVGQNLFTSTCTGVGITATARRTLPAGTILEIDTGLAPSFLSINGAGDKVFSAKRITAGGTGGAAAVYSVGATAVTEVAIEAAGVAEGSLATDGSSVIYRTNLGALKKANAAAPVNATVLVPQGGVMGILATSPDRKGVLTHELAPGGDLAPVYDLQLSSGVTPGAPTTLVPTATALEFGFTLGSKYALWVPDPATATVLKAKPVAGGAEIDLGAASVFLGKIDGSDKIVLGDNEREITVGGQPVTVVDFKLVDPATNAGTPLAKGAEIGAVVMPGGKQMAYTEAAKGLYIVDIP